MKRINLLLLSLLFILTSCSSAPNATTEVGRFPIYPNFQKFYEAQGGFRTFGATITPDLKEGEITVQYFENLRLEYHPQLPEGNRVIISNLSAELSKENQTRCIRSQDVDLTAYFFNDCHSVVKSVQQYFNQKGGVIFFGFPISELTVTSDGRLVQHFERASIVWDPTKPREYQFSLLNLGQLACNELCDQKYRSAVPKASQPTPTTPPTPKKISVKTQPEFPVLTPNKQQQSLSAWVTDENGKPVSNASVSFLIQLPPGSVTRHQSNLTNSKGFATIKIDVNGYKAGDFISYAASATYNGITSIDYNYFVAWDK